VLAREHVLHSFELLVHVLDRFASRERERPELRAG
jgi:hypothetical protein